MAEKIRLSLIDEYNRLFLQFNTPPGIAIIKIGNNPILNRYLTLLADDFANIGFYALTQEFSEFASTEEVKAYILNCNMSHSIDGILLGLPLPQTMAIAEIKSAIALDKDIDGQNPLNFCNSAHSIDSKLSATSEAVLSILENIYPNMRGLNITIVGASTLVGRPLGYELLNRECTLSVCNCYTRDLAQYTQNADVVISATGVAGLITGNMIKTGSTVIDVGVSIVNKKVVGDVHFESVKEKAAYITTVPNGVGLLNRAYLLRNTFHAWKDHCFSNMNQERNFVEPKVRTNLF